MSLPLPVPAQRPIVAAGAELKATFCVARGGEAFLSPHLGDLDDELSYRAFRTDLELYLRMLDVTPEAVACDLHPEYRATKWAQEQGLPLVEVQHHHAHAAACLAEHGETREALAVVLDGTGYGPDGMLWGGELLRCDLASFERLAHLDPVPLPGGEAAIREPWRMAAAYLERAGRPVPFERWALVLSLVPDLSRWPAPERRSLLRMIRAKGDTSEAAYVRLMDGQSRLRQALERLVRDAAPAPAAARP